MYVVWSPQAGGRQEHVPSAASLLRDHRARHYWDPSMSAGRAVSASLSLPRPAWDVWILYGPDAAWTDEGLPEPDWWEHQLAALSDENWLDPERFARVARELSSSSR